MTSKAQTVFPAPDHDHGSCTSSALTHAEQLCAARGQRLTQSPRRLLEAWRASHKPLGAYEVMDRLGSKRRPAPISVYRALDFLRENGLVHRIESRNSFVACVHSHASDALVAFLICERCGGVGEPPAAAVGQSLAAAARSAGFSPSLSVIEITGTCAHCRK